MARPRICSFLCSRIIQREAVQAIDEKLSKTGKLDLIKGQPAYLADMSKKRKQPHESDRGGNTVEHVEKVKKPRKPQKPRNITTMQIDPSQPWKVLNHKSYVNPLTSTIPTIPTAYPAVDATVMVSGSEGPQLIFSNDPFRPAKKAKISRLPTIASTGDNVCSLCGGPKHSLRDCPVPKGGVEK